MHRYKAVRPSHAEAPWNMDPPSIETMMKACGAWFNQANRMRDETMRFAHERFTKELDAVAQLARCTNPNEALAVQAEFANRMAEDYVAEGQKIVELMGKMAEEIAANPDTVRAPRGAS